MTKGTEDAAARVQGGDIETPPEPPAMIRTALLLAATLTAFTPAAPALADEIAEKLCPLLAEAAAETDSGVIQMILVFGMVDGVVDPEELGELPPHADAIADAACPDDRAAVLAAARTTSLESLLR